MLTKPDKISIMDAAVSVGLKYENAKAIFRVYRTEQDIAMPAHG